mmetsp:Transcript_46474/g.88737  ORF Transcript_46474/g.88737 Transcript_46474/m.88737 type:complete len:230 (-) Transcript_46474:581-1270(-)
MYEQQGQTSWCKFWSAVRLTCNYLTQTLIVMSRSQVFPKTIVSRYILCTVQTTVLVFPCSSSSMLILVLQKIRGAGSHALLFQVSCSLGACPILAVIVAYVNDSGKYMAKRIGGHKRWEIGYFGIGDWKTTSAISQLQDLLRKGAWAVEPVDRPERLLDPLLEADSPKLSTPLRPLPTRSLPDNFDVGSGSMRAGWYLAKVSSVEWHWPVGTAARRAERRTPTTSMVLR